MSKARASRARLDAIRLVHQVLDQGGEMTLADTRADKPRDLRDAAFARRLAWGLLRWYGALDWLTAQLLQKPLKSRDRDIQRLLMLGLYQLWKEDTPPHAAIHETAEAARGLRKNWAVGLINACLRRFQREQDELLSKLAENDASYAHPQWMLERLRQDWPEGAEVDWRQIVHANNQAPPLWLRLHAGHDRKQTLAAMEQAGFETETHPWAEQAVWLKPAASVNQIPGFSEGHLSVQDPAAQLAADLLDLKPGQRVLDACSAPGGKTCHILEQQPAVALTALDSNAERLERVRENLQRLGFEQHEGLHLEAADANDTDQWWDGQTFDRILLDAPCSATGVIRRHPEIKWLRTPQQVDRARAAQATLLRSLWPLLRPGGMLLYATCSIFRQENEQQVKAFLDETPDAAHQHIEASWGLDTGFGRQLLPGQSGVDGFFYACLQKTQ